MLPTHSLMLPLFGSVATAANLLVSHYAGTISSLSFNNNALKLTSEASTGNALPSWITYDGVGKQLYIPSEALAPLTTGDLISYKVSKNGSSTPSGKVSAPMGQVATILYGGPDGRSFIANAHYHAAQVTTFKLPLNGGAPLQSLKYTMSGPGVDPIRQEAPHPHHVLVDPTGQFLLVIDLGADQIRINKIDAASGKLTECPSATPAPGSGIRHAAFWTPSGGYSRIQRGKEGTKLFVVNELTNTVAGWSVSYPAGGCLTLSLKQTLTPYQGNSSAVAGTSVGEIKVKDNFLYNTNRNDTKFDGSDSITQYTIASDGTLTWTDITSTYGHIPRTFDINKRGDFLAFGNQASANIAIVPRDCATGKLGKLAANLRVGPTGTPGGYEGISAVVWQE